MVTVALPVWYTGKFPSVDLIELLHVCNLFILYFQLPEEFIILSFHVRIM